jgi:hypothetical protein
MVFHVNKPFFTESDFCDDGGYWKSRDYVIVQANVKVEKLVDVVERVLRQDEQRGYPTTAEWFSICKAASEIKS